MAKGTKKRKRAAHATSKSPQSARKALTFVEVVAPRSKFWIWILVAQALLIVAAVLWIYGPVLHGDWLWDDDYLIEKNDLIHDPYGIWNIWLAPDTLIDYFPLTVSLDWLEWQLWPNDTFSFHLTNLLLHACSALLVWRLLSKLGLRFAWLGGLLFAVHPVMVESVAWMAELKNTLSMPPFLLAMCAWIEFDRSGKWDHYFIALGLFLVAMLCKTSMVMFPVIILLYAWWKHGRIERRDLKLSAPFFGISLALGLMVIACLRHGVGEETIPLGGFLARAACGGTSIVFYFSKCVLPLYLSPIYPQWDVNPPTVWQFIPWAVFGGAVYWLWMKREPWSRNILFALGFFVINLAPFVGFHIISFMRFSWVMDHFLYLPIIAWFGLAVGALEQLDRKLGAAKRPYWACAAAVVMLALTISSHRYSKIYINSIALWTYTIHRYAEAWPAYNDLGNALSDAGRISEAEASYKTALLINPGYPEAHNNLGIIYARTGHLRESLTEFQLALKYCPDLESAQDNLAKVQASLPEPPVKN